MEEQTETYPSVPCENCPKGVPEGKKFEKDGKFYCCGKCAETGKSENVCEFC